jgi:polysaccharide biosynthesis transport protein
MSKDANMSDLEPQTHQPGMKLGDILFMLFRHKWKILVFAVLGIAGAAAIYLLSPPVYESSARLFVRYVVERSALDNVENQIKTDHNSQSNSLLNSEVQILTSGDLAKQVVEKVGINRFQKNPKGGVSTEEVAREMLKSLSVSPVKDSDIIEVSYKNQNPELATAVLQNLVNLYFDKHLEIHRSTGAFDLVKREEGQIRVRLDETEAELKDLRARAGINSLAEGTKEADAELSRSRQELDTAKAELAAQKARVSEMQKLMAGEVPSESSHGSKMEQPSPQILQEYQSLMVRLNSLRQSETELLSRYTAGSPMVKVKRGQIDDLERQRRDYEKKYPSILASAPLLGSTTVGAIPMARPDLVTDKARLVELQAKTDLLKIRLNTAEQRERTLADLTPRITELERKRDVEEANYKYFQASLEKARVDETLDPSRMPNISLVQKPSVALRATRDLKKVVLGLVLGGLGGGIGLALLIELLLDHSVKRTRELETLQIPLLLSIPFFGRNRQLRLDYAGASTNGSGDWRERDLPVPSHGDFMRPFCEAIRDRLVLAFEAEGMVHRPKLVAVTGASKGAGATTVAEGLATTFSELCDGKVLLVDGQIEPRRFFRMIADFKASEFDYVIFDLPAISDTNATASLVSLVDRVLLVVEAEKSTRDMVKRAYAQLLAAKTSVTAILNKTRVAGPNWLLHAGA